MPTTERRAENLSPILADRTISGDRGMLVLQAAEPDKSPVSPREGIRYVMLRLCAIVGVAMLIAAGLLWFPGMRQSANFAIQDKTLAQVTASGGKVEVPPTKVESPVAENDLAATIGKPAATAPSLPVAEAGSTGGTPKPTSQSALAPVASGPVPGPALATTGAAQPDNNEIAMFVRRGKGFLKDGDLTSARLLFQRAAAAGNAEASFILGTTFDPQFIRRMGVVGMESDIARAREWYKRAAELGSADASQQLATEGTRE